jgi:hypothetical protein
MDNEVIRDSVLHHEPSIFRGGPFYRAQVALGVIREGEWNHVRRLVVAVAVSWLPLVLLTALFNPAGLTSLLTSYRVYSRLLIAVPALLIGQHVMESRFKMIVRAIIDAHLLDDADLKRMDKIVVSLIRLRDWWVPEAMVIVLLFMYYLMVVRNDVDAVPWLAYGMPPNIHLTAAGWYALTVSNSIFEFLLGLSLWKWLLWTAFSFRISRLNLNLIPTHPDGKGGLGFLSFTPVAVTPISFAVTAAIGASWRHDILAHGARLMSFRLDAIVLLMLVGIIALGPLAFFVPRLAALRRQGMLDYGVLGQIQSNDFHTKWVRRLTGNEAGFLDAPESSTLADYGASYDKLSKLRPFPVDREALIALAISVAIPVLPVVLAVFPLMVVLEDLLKAMR